MNRYTQSITALAFSLVTSVTVAEPPKALITHNHTSVESNAYVAGHASPVPSKPHSDNIVPWVIVQMACLNHQDICPATIKMATNTSHPITLGNVTLNVKTGEITPSHLSANGYTLTVNGPGEATLTEN